MIHVPIGTVYGIWLRCPNQHGGKDWLGFLTDRQVLSQWGRTGQVNQSTVLFDRPSRLDLDRKIREKLNKGYQLVAEYANGGWDRSSGQTSQPAPAPPKPPKTPQPAKSTKAPEAVTRWLSDTDNRHWF